MRWINRAIVMSAVVLVSAIGAWAQDTCTDELKTAKYSEWYDNRKDKQDVAYKAASDFLAACPNEAEDGPWGPQVKALKKFKADYDALHSNKEMADKFEKAGADKNYAEQIRLGKQLVAIPANAENPAIYLLMGQAGLGDANQLAESAQAAKKAIQLVEGGKPFAPFATKDQALAVMNYVIAKSMVKASPTESIAYFVKAAKYESDLKKNPQFYNELATAYGDGPVDKYAKDYKAAADAGKSIDSPEVKLAVANLNQALDGQIDAFARAAAYATAPDKTEIMKVLADVYKDRNKTAPTPEQLNTLVASALTKPIPDAPKPITEVPASSSTPASGGTSATPTNGSGSGSTAGSGSTGSAKPTATAPTSSTSTKPATSGTTPAAKPTPTPKPRQRARYRG